VPIVDVEVWLAPRLAGAPTELAEAVLGLVGELAEDSEASGLNVPEALAAAAMLGFEGVLERFEPKREVALRLLAADAVLTYAFEAAASLGKDVNELAIRIGLSGELGSRLQEGDVGLPHGGIS